MENRKMTEELVIRARQNCCRLCLAPDSECVPIFTTSAADKEPLFTKIIACIGIKVSRSDRLSCRICHACISYLNSWQSFKNRCVAAQVKQQNWLEMVKNPTGQYNVRHEFGPGLNSMNGSGKCPKSNYQRHLPFMIKQEPIDDMKFVKTEATENVKLELDPRHLLPRDVEITIEQPEGTSSTPSSSANAPNILASLGLTSVHSGINPYSFLSTELNDSPYGLDFKSKMSSMNSENYETSTSCTTPPSCRICKMQFSTRANARRHERNKHGRLSITSTSQIVNKSQPVQVTPEMMGIFDYTNPTKYRHLLTDQKILFLRRNEEFMKQYQDMTCKCCSKEHPSYKNFMVHMRKKYPSLARNLCFKCLRQFQSKAMFVAHLKKKNCINLYKVFMSDESIPKNGPLFSSPDKMGTKELLANKIYECKLCNKTFRLKLDFRTHVNDEHNEEIQKKEQSPGICVFCGIEVTDPVTRKRHYGNNECIVILHCGTCKETFESHQKFIDHVYNTHLPTSNNEVSQSENTANNGILPPNLEESSLSSLGYPQSCTICGQKYNNYYNVLRHMEAKHPDQLPKTYNCDKCDTGFARQSSLREHMYDVHGTTLPRTPKRDVYSCRLCSDTFDHPLKWVAHQTEKHQKYVCCHCTYQTESMDDFKAHLEEHPLMASRLGLNVPTEYDTGMNGEINIKIEHSSDFGPSAKKAKIEEDNVKKECQTCHEVFDNSIALSNHMKTHLNVPHQKQMLANERLVNVRPLNIKDKILTGTGAPSVATSATFGDPRFRRMRCRICQKRFSTKKSYRRHMLVDHQIRNVQFIKCGVCNAEFTHEKGLKVHMFKIHQTILTNDSMEVQFECEVCGTVYRNEDQLNAHKSTVHGIQSIEDVPMQVSESPLPPTSNDSTLWFQCRYCPANFDTNKKLAIHINSHEEFDSKDYSCKDCGNVYSGRKSLWVHRYKKHPMVPDPAECKICIKMFFDKNMLFMHLKTHSATDVYEQLQKLQKNMKKEDTTETKANPKVENPAGDENGNEELEDEDEMVGHVACSMCGDKFNDQDLFDKHMQMHEMELYSDNPLASMFDTGPDDSRPSLDDECDEHGCDLCDKSFATPSALKAHRNWHFRSDAKQTPSEPPELRTANRKKCDPSSIRCHFCNATFTKRNNLRRHIVTLHKDKLNKQDNEGHENSRECQKCTITFPSLTEFIAHKINDLKTVALIGEDTNWTCEICSNSFSSRDKLVQHMPSHLKKDRNNASAGNVEQITSEIGSENNSRDSASLSGLSNKEYNYTKHPHGKDPSPDEIIIKSSNGGAISNVKPDCTTEINFPAKDDNVQDVITIGDESNVEDEIENELETDEEADADIETSGELSEEEESNEEFSDNESVESNLDDDIPDTSNQKISKTNVAHVVGDSIQKAEPKSSGSYSCDLCQVYFDTSKELRRHVTSHFLNGPGSVTLTEIPKDKSNM